VIEYLRTLLHYLGNRLQIPAKVRGKDLYGSIRKTPPDRPDGGNKMPRPTIRKVVPVDRGQNDVLEPQNPSNLRNPEGFQRIGGKGLSRRDSTETTSAGANLTQEKKGCHPPPETLTTVRTAGFLANRPKLKSPQLCLGIRKILEVKNALLHSDSPREGKLLSF
jgi:hypothetical protein